MSLNPAQQAAVDHTHGPLLVLAGAGSGKTRVITHRIARLVERGIRPETILAVSFTNKAAAEMAERMHPLIGKKRTEKLWLSTFHSFGVRFLREENRALGFDGRFVIFDQGDSLGLVREILKRESLADRNMDIPALLTRISLWKNAFMLPEDVEGSDFEYDDIAAKVYPIYQETLEGMHAVDFDDLVVAPVKILKRQEHLREKWRARFQHLLIDEFQDTNRSQLQLIRLLAPESGNVCVVGDDDQSIYGWRGAEVGNILEFEETFPGAKVVKLEVNYRSCAPILDIANSVIQKSRGKRHEKTLRSYKGPGPRVRLVVLPDAAQEAKFLVKEIRQLSKGGEVSPDGRIFPYGNIAVLYRSNTQARILEEEMRLADVPYKVFGGTQFFDRKEVKDVIAYLRVAVHPRDELSLRRILNTPPRGIGAGTLEKVRAHALRSGKKFADALADAETLDIPAKAKRGVENLLSGLADARRRIKDGDSIVALTEQLMLDVGLTQSLEGDQSPHGKRRRENIVFLLRSLQRFEERKKMTLDQFLTSLTLRAEQDEKESAHNRVTLSSLHSAKGLEFDVVFLIGCVEGLLPHSRTTDPKLTEAAPTDVDEERRLFYVGITRAKDLLYLSRAERRTMRGRVTPRTPSRFLEGFPEDAWEAYTPIGQKQMDSDEMSEMASALLAMLRN
ncbi:MAG: UvrD-helicase domain-containing protein [Myxococcota bacterium]